MKKHLATFIAALMAASVYIANPAPLSALPGLLSAELLPEDAILSEESVPSTQTDAPPAVAPGVPQEELISALTGIWEGFFPVYTSDSAYYQDAVTLDFDATRTHPMMLRVASIDAACSLPPNSWKTENGTLTFSFYEEPWLAELSLQLSENRTRLDGTCTQLGRTTPIAFEKRSDSATSESALQTEFMFEKRPASDWLRELQKYSDFSADGDPLGYTYDLNNREKTQPMLDVYGVEAAISGRSDVEQMKATLDIVSNHFRHDGRVALPKQADALSLINYHNQYGGIECRGLSVILSEMLRSCGIPAKPIMCIPSSEPCEDCHVVVHAYSRSLGQWIMLDPTYHLMLQNESGQYLSLPMLRSALARGETLIPNPEAGRNDQPFFLPYYRAYMTKNTFRFACATQFYFGGERFADTDTKGEVDPNAGSLFGTAPTAASTDFPHPMLLSTSSGKRTGNFAKSTVPKIGKLRRSPRAPKSDQPAQEWKPRWQNDKNPQNMLVPLNYKVPYLYSRSERVTTCAAAFWAAPDANQ